MDKMERIHVRAAKIVYKLDWRTPSDQVLVKAKWNTIRGMNSKRLLRFAYINVTMVMFLNNFSLLLGKVIIHKILEES